jgi:hypothetical protein
MNWMGRANWLVGAVFVLLIMNALALWPVNRVIAGANLVADGLILVYSVVQGYRSPTKE